MPPVDDQSRGTRDPVKSTRVVIAGDTLYSIAWEIGQDYRTLAKWNNIRSPFIIKKGQRLKIKSQDAYTVNSTRSNKRQTANSNTKTHTVVAGDTIYSLARKNGISAKTLAKWNGISSPYVISIGQKLKLTGRSSQSKKTRVARNNRNSKNLKKPEAKQNFSSEPHSKIKGWGWPAKGRVSKRFGHNGRKGLEIKGKVGQPVRAAAAGKVVYQGSGLRGYGQLVIIKHNQDFLSAYAHCDRIVVSEGDVIKKGQQIASMGKTGTNKVKLHFEIRYRGSPVNPEKYLRRR